MDILGLTSLIPAEITVVSIAKFIGLIAVIVILSGALIRLIFGKHAPLNRTLSAAIGILWIYIFTVIIYIFNPAGLEKWLTPLPFVKFSGECLYIFPITAAPFSDICGEFLPMVILATLYHLADELLPVGETTFRWFVLRILTVSLSIGIHYLLTRIVGNDLPELIVHYAPTILMILLALSLLGGILGVLLGLILTVVNPLLGILCGFFFSNKIGKQISKAMLTSAILSALVAFLETFEYSVISISSTALFSYIPLLAVLMGLWYLLDRKL